MKDHDLVLRLAWSSRSRGWSGCGRSEEHTSELQSQSNLVCRLLLEKKKSTRLIVRAVLVCGLLAAPGGAGALAGVGGLRLISCCGKPGVARLAPAPGRGACAVRRD